MKGIWLKFAPVTENVCLSLPRKTKSTSVVIFEIKRGHFFTIVLFLRCVVAELLSCSISAASFLITFWKIPDR